MQKAEQSKSKLHPRSKHLGSYDFKSLGAVNPALTKYVKLNAYNNESIDFFDAGAVKQLNKALLLKHYDLKDWDIPEGFLCPPIPGRADYIHYAADLIYQHNYSFLHGKHPKGDNINVLDIGVGANIIYPIIGIKSYGWSFVGTEIDADAMAAASVNLEANPSIKDKLELRKQSNAKQYFKGIIEEGEKYELSVCNPPFHDSEAAVLASNKRKLSNLKSKKVKEANLNFGGRSMELWCEGGAEQFLRSMIGESKEYGKSVCWFSSLVAKKASLKNAYQALKMYKAKEVVTIPMGQGNKSSRIVAWSFLGKAEQRKWMKNKWD